MKSNETGNASKCAKKSTKKGYKRKRKYTGNQYSSKYTKKDCNAEKTSDNDEDVGVKTRRSVLTEEDKMASASFRKIIDVPVTASTGLQGFRLLDMSLLQEFISLFDCPECQKGGTIYITEDPLKRKGLASYIQVECSNCSFEYSSYTSKNVDNNDKTFEVNIRSIYAMRRCGVGHKGLQKFCGVMNMPPPMARKNYDKLSDKLGAAVEKVAKTSMIQAAIDVKACEGTDIGVSFDGTWQKRGHSTMNGVCTAIWVSTGKVLDSEILSRHCKNCVLHAPLKETNPTAYDVWNVDHKDKCELNHDGSASSMEGASAVTIFSRSVETYGLRYVGYYGDGDSSSFTNVENVYKNVKVVKFECIGHYQKSSICEM